MGLKSLHSASQAVWRLAVCQHGVVARRQLLELGFSSSAIQHRIANGRLHRVGRGVYALGRPALTQHGRWMAAVLGCGPRAFLSHGSAAALWRIGPLSSGPVEVSITASARRRPGIRVYRRPNLQPFDLTTHLGIPVTSLIRTLVDMAGRLDRVRLERAINEADRLELVNPEELSEALNAYTGQPGVRPLRELLDEQTFLMTDSELERRFLPFTVQAGLPAPLTRQYVNGFRVDFYWPDLRLVVETDGLRYHRTPAQQARDRLRDQAHTVAGFTPLRFTHAQVRFEAGYVRSTLSEVARRLEAERAA